MGWEITGDNGPAADRKNPPGKNMFLKYPISQPFRDGAVKWRRLVKRGSKQKIYNPTDFIETKTYFEKNYCSDPTFNTAKT